MTIRLSNPEIITVNSEALETQIRDLLPSQSGFGSELQASNVITPIIDLTAAAEGSALRADLQTALAFGSQTFFDARAGTTALANSPGFWRVTYVISIKNASAADHESYLAINDGVTSKVIYGVEAISTADLQYQTVPVDFTVFLRAGDTLNIVNDVSSIVCTGSYRQVATGDGTIVNPNGYPL
jgi:hypothetical protein